MSSAGSGLKLFHVSQLKGRSLQNLSWNLVHKNLNGVSSVVIIFDERKKEEALD